MLTSDPKGGASPEHTGVQRAAQPVLFQRSTIPWSRWMSTRPRRTWTECFASSWLTAPSPHRPGSTWRSFGHRKGLVNPSQAISNLCRGLVSQRLGLFEARGHINDRESVAVGFPPYAVVWQKEQIRLVDFVGHRHVKLRPRCAPWGRQIDLPDGLPFEPVLGPLSVTLTADTSFSMAASPFQ